MTAQKALEAIDVECSKCFSEPYEPCHQVTRLGFIAIDTLSRKPHAARVRAASARREGEAVKWKPISTAPVDGTPVLACSRGPWPDWHSMGLHPTTVRFRAFHPNQPAKVTWRDQNGRPVYPTHWTPLPNPPLPGAEGRGR